MGLFDQFNEGEIPDDEFDDEICEVVTDVTPTRFEFTTDVDSMIILSDFKHSMKTRPKYEDCYKTCGMLFDEHQIILTVCNN